LGDPARVARDDGEIAERTNISPEALEAARGEALKNTHAVTVRDGVATIPVAGPMFRYASFFTRISGATAYEDSRAISSRRSMIRA
jgi:hypothetical protein